MDILVNATMTIISVSVPFTKLHGKVCKNGKHLIAKST